jgi:hypothetical protein
MMNMMITVVYLDDVFNTSAFEGILTIVFWTLGGPLNLTIVLIPWDD